jgi:hypothetical protein
MHITPRSEHSRYRCYLNRSTAISDTGEREFVQLKAASAATAAHLAHAVTGAGVVEVVRLEEVAS